MICRGRIDELLSLYPNINRGKYDGLSDILLKITEETGDKFIFIVDKWDAICREFNAGSKAYDSYVTWLRSMFKDINSSRIFAGVYMTGIFPVKKYPSSG